MQLLDCSSVPIDVLIGSLAVNPNGIAFRILDVRLDLATLAIQLVMSEVDAAPSDSVAIDYNALSDWSLQLGDLP